MQLAQEALQYANKSAAEFMSGFILKKSIPDLLTLETYLNQIYRHPTLEQAQSNQIAPDWLYDTLESYLKERNVLPGKVGGTPPEEQVNLPIWVGSQDKVFDNNLAALSRYMERAAYKGDKKFQITPKFDGISGVLEINETGVPKLYTRGDGVKGSDISHLIPYLHLPVQIFTPTTQKMYFRGEIIMKKQTFIDRGYNQTYKNIRNMTAGLVGTKDYNKNISILQDLDYVVYELINGNPAGPQHSQVDQLRCLKEQGFTCSDVWITKSEFPAALAKELSSYYQYLKTNYMYDIDGLILQPNGPYTRNNEYNKNPKYAIAFKLAIGETAVGVVHHVEWNVSKHGRIIPRVILTHPVELESTQVGKTAGFNAEYIFQNKVGPGATLLISKRGTVIPHIEQVINPATEAQMPPGEGEAWKWDGVHIIQIGDSHERRIKSMINFFHKLKIKNLGPGRIAVLYGQGQDDPGNHYYRNIYSLVTTDANTIVAKKFPKIGLKTAQNIVGCIRQVFQSGEVSKGKFLGAMGVFGLRLGSDNLRKLEEKIPDVFDQEVPDMKAILKISGFKNNAAVLQERWSQAKALIQKYDPLIKWKTMGMPTAVKAPPAGATVTFKGKTILYSGGELPAAWIRIMLNEGGNVVKSWSNKVDILVIRTQASKTGKYNNMVKAQRADVEKKGKTERKIYDWAELEAARPDFRGDVQNNSDEVKIPNANVQPAYGQGYAQFPVNQEVQSQPMTQQLQLLNQGLQPQSFGQGPQSSVTRQLLNQEFQPQQNQFFNQGFQSQQQNPQTAQLKLLDGLF